MEKLTSNLFEEKVVNSGRPVLIDFNTPWCGPCKKLTPIVEELAEEYKETVDIYEVDASAEPGIAQKYGVMSIPTLVFFNNGEMTDRIVGLVAKDKIQKKLQSLLD